ncbi:MAG: ABC transporter ATP-binding protein, partial [Candidatus Sulfotelmatobacter sp.]
MAGKQDSWNGWRERIAALRNVPAVLRIVWESGRTVVVLGVVFRVVASVLPLGLLWITKLIIDILVR